MRRIASLNNEGKCSTQEKVFFAVDLLRWDKKDEDPEVGLGWRRYVDDGADGEDLDDTY